jgi:DNA-binding transcriptional regulator YdaS (Cro superfamily)
MSIALAVRHYGSQRRMALALGVTDSQVSQWVKRGAMSPGKALKVEADTGGGIRALHLIEGQDDKNDG